LLSFIILPLFEPESSISTALSTGLIIVLELILFSDPTSSMFIPNLEFAIVLLCMEFSDAS
jgi:hypothetical protein